MSTSIYTDEFGPSRKDRQRLKACERTRRARERNPELNKQYYSRTKQERLAYNKIWYANNPQYNKQYESANKPRRAKINKKWRKNNSLYFTEYYNSNRSTIINRSKVWRENNPGKINSSSARRRALLNKATPKWAKQSVIDLIYKRCDELNTVWGTNFEVDHVVPLRGKTVCGLHCEDNLQLLDQPINASKNNHTWPCMP